MATAGPDSPARSPVGVSVAPPIPVGRRAVLYAVRRIGDATVDEVAAHLGITASGARQHLSSLAEHGLVDTIEIRESGLVTLLGGLSGSVGSLKNGLLRGDQRQRGWTKNYLAV